MKKFYIIEKKAEPEDYAGTIYANDLEILEGEEEDLTPNLDVVHKLREMTPEAAEMVASRPHVKSVVEDFAVGIPPEPEVSAESTITSEQSRAFHKVPEAHALGFTGKGARVAVLDTGLDSQWAEKLGKRLVHKSSVVSDEDWTDTNSGHGTWCVGCVADIAIDAEIVVIKVLSTRTGSGSGSGIIKAINNSVALGCTHISMSLGGPGNPDDAMCRAVDAAFSKGVLSANAAGNDQRGTTSYTADRHHPGCSKDGVCVGAIDINGAMGVFSSWGICLDVTAQGVRTESWGLNGQRGAVMSGTSMATPHVAGILALAGRQNHEVARKNLYASAVDTGFEPYKEGNGFCHAEAFARTFVQAPLPEPGPVPPLPPTPEPAPTYELVMIGKLYQSSRSFKGRKLTLMSKHGFGWKCDPLE